MVCFGISNIFQNLRTNNVLASCIVSTKTLPELWLLRKRNLRLRIWENNFTSARMIADTLRLCGEILLKTKERFGYVTLVECKLETGRTHQIRAHMRFIGHPLFNDSTYGGDRIVKGTTFTKYKQFVDNCFTLCPRQALHAKKLSFLHPKTKEWVEFDSEIPDDMKALIEEW